MMKIDEEEEEEEEVAFLGRVIKLKIVLPLCFRISSFLPSVLGTRAHFLSFSFFVFIKNKSLIFIS